MAPADASAHQPDDRERYRRRTARVLLVDGAGGILLFRLPRVHGKPEQGHCWITPGGGVDEGESLAEAAARELREETGLTVDPAAIGAPVAVTSGYADLGWTRGVFRDDFFLHRTTVRDIDTTGFTAAERRLIAGHRWWTPDELRAAPEPVYPLRLADLLDDLLADGPTATPVRLPWHHDDPAPA
ncbi:NUDIX hydrolase [Spirillospora albida]|uniref:NUDIX hydrolase n=1 Tax=Spirillospora albida TaxID=58123 RepID=UPI000AC1B751|nr:NUDIX domain-containing protein [Spirillospora albida]